MSVPANPTLPVSKLKATSRLLPLIWLVMLAVQLVFPYRGWIILLVGLGGAWLLSRIWARSLAEGLRLERETRFHWSQVGDVMQEHLRLVNRSPFSAPWVELTDHSSIPTPHRNRAFAIGPTTSLRWRERVVCGQRGKFVLGPTTLRTADPFGMFEVEINLTETASLLVLPPVIPWSTLPFLSQGRQEEGRAVQAVAESGVAATQVRPYVPGDSLRRIHWPTSAKHGELHIRQFDRETRGEWLIVLDMARGHHSGVGVQSTVEACVVLAASMAEYGLREGRSVGLASLAPEGLVWKPPRQGLAYRWDILASLAEVQMGESSLSDLFRLAIRRQSGETSLMAITPCTRLSEFEPLLTGEGSRRPPQAGVVLLDAKSGVQGEADRASSQLRERGLLSWVVSQAALEGMLASRVPHQARLPADPGWKRTSP